jgi:hypothetical protein
MSWRLEPKPILAGLAVMFVAPVVFAILGRLFGVILIGILIETSVISPSQISAFVQSPFAYILLSAFNGAFSLVVGYVTGRLAQDRKVLHAVAVAVLAVAIEWLGRSFSRMEKPPLFFGLLADSVTIVFAALGGYWAAKRMGSTQVSLNAEESTSG